MPDGLLVVYSLFQKILIYTAKANVNINKDN